MRLTFAKGQMKLLVIGAGMMGSAAAFDMARSSGVESVTLADCDIARAQDAARFIAKSHGKKGASVQPVALDAADEGSASALMRGHTGVLSAVPYFFNVHLARAAIGAGCHFADLGGNNTVVRKTLAMGAEAEKNGIGLAPDCGLSPGMASVLAGDLVRRLRSDKRRGRAGKHAKKGEKSSIDALRLYVGGLPKKPRPPFEYQLVFSVEGLINEYVEPARVLKNGAGRISHSRLSSDGCIPHFRRNLNHARNVPGRSWRVLREDFALSQPLHADSRAIRSRILLEREAAA